MVTPAELRALADQIETDTRYGPTARRVAAAILRGTATRHEREEGT